MNVLKGMFRKQSDCDIMACDEFVVTYIIPHASVPS